jgi:hypothetical protein
MNSHRKVILKVLEYSGLLVSLFFAWILLILVLRVWSRRYSYIDNPPSLPVSTQVNHIAVIVPKFEPLASLTPVVSDNNNREFNDSVVSYVPPSSLPSWIFDLILYRSSSYLSLKSSITTFSTPTKDERDEEVAVNTNKKLFPQSARNQSKFYSFFLSSSKKNIELTTQRLAAQRQKEMRVLLLAVGKLQLWVEQIWTRLHNEPTLLPQQLPQPSGLFAVRWVVWLLILASRTLMIV